eukprot:5446329-Pleurochrysis_carterae.AAC.1
MSILYNKNSEVLWILWQATPESNVRIDLGLILGVSTVDTRNILACQVLVCLGTSFGVVEAQRWHAVQACISCVFLLGDSANLRLLEEKRARRARRVHIVPGHQHLPNQIK